MEALNMNTFQLACFLAVAETLSFAKAAKQLNITQPAVTHQIRSLEEELNTQLFKRTTRTEGLTPEGLIFLNDARNVLNIISSAKKRFEQPAADERQFFSIGCHSHIDVHLLPDVLRQMANAHPALYPVFQVVPFQHLYQLLDEDTVDVVIAFQEKGQKKATGIYKELTKINILAALPAGHPYTQKLELSAEDFVKEKVIITEPQGCPDSLNNVQHELVKSKPISELFLCHSVDACTTLVKAGFGVAIIPDMPSLKDPVLSYVPIKDMEPLSYGAYYKSVTGNPLLKLFLQLCKDIFLSE